MKKIKIFLVVAFTFIIGYHVYGVQKTNVMFDITMANVEALSSEESIYDYKQPKTIVCDLQEGEWHTGAVERICEFCAVPYSCTPFPCGGN